MHARMLSVYVFLAGWRTGAQVGVSEVALKSPKVNKVRCGEQRINIAAIMVPLLPGDASAA